MRHVRIDVLGVRDVGGDLAGEIETIAIEVKRGGTPFVVAAGQTLGYRVCVNRVYLADARHNPFSPDELQIASNLGIGLIQIRGSRCIEQLSSPFYHPITRINLLLLEGIGLGRCQMCSSFFDLGREKYRFARVSREELDRAIAEGKGMIFWNYEVAKRKRRLLLRQAGGEMSYERRFICPECVEVFFAPPE